MKLKIVAQMFRQNIEKGYCARVVSKETDIESAVKFYYTLFFRLMKIHY
jgi:hypothetical protein